MGLFVGTSGWIYKHWAAAFYPTGIGRTRQLSYYAGRFNTVELNASFYRLPTLKAAQGWHDAVPGDFLFAVKGSRFITHMKKLNVTPESIAIFFERIAPLGDRCGPLLWQLPPHFRKDLARLTRFLDALPPGFRHAVEFREASWYDDDVFGALRERNVAHVAVSSGIMPDRFEVTADFHVPALSRPEAWCAAQLSPPRARALGTSRAARAGAGARRVRVLQQ